MRCFEELDWPGKYTLDVEPDALVRKLEHGNAKCHEGVSTL
jgi:hypothetical protein